MKQYNLDKLLNQEFSVLNKVRHRNICQFLGIERSASSIYLVFELCSGGDMQKYLETNGALPELKA